MHVNLGNPAAREGQTVLTGQRVTTATIPDEYTDAEALRAVTADDGVWANHSTADAPAWVESDNPEFAELLSAHYGSPVGRPDTWGDDPEEGE